MITKINYSGHFITFFYFGLISHFRFFCFFYISRFAFTVTQGEDSKVSARCNYRLHVDLITNPPPINELRSMHDYIHNVGGGGISGTIKLQRAGLLNQQPANSEHYITKQRGGGQ